AAALGHGDRGVVVGIGERLEAPVDARGARVDDRGHLHAQRLMRALLVVALDEGIEARLLLEHVRLGRPRRLSLQREMHPLVPAVLLGLARLDALDANAEPQPPHRQFAQPVERMPRRKGHPVVGANRTWEPEVLERPLEDGKRKLLLRRRQRLAGQQVAAREVGDGERIAVLPIAELELAFVVGTPEGIRLRRAREYRAGGRGRAAAAPLAQAWPVEPRGHRTDRRQLHAWDLLPEILPALGRAPARVLALQPDDRRLERRGQPIRLALRPPTAIGKRPEPAVFVALEDLIAGLERNAEGGAQRRHLLALEQAGDKPKPLVHDVTLLPRHAPLL